MKRGERVEFQNNRYGSSDHKNESANVNDDNSVKENAPSTTVIDVVYRCRYASRTTETLIRTATYSDQREKSEELGEYPNDNFDTFLRTSCSEEMYRRMEAEKKDSNP
jgi:hypothetical protein